MQNENKNKSRLISLILFLLLMIGAIIGLEFLVNYWIKNLYWEYDPLHSALEITGTLSAILMAVVLLQREQEKYEWKLFFMVLGFLSMGILDGFHAIYSAGERFVLLHSEASLIGGFCFALVWFQTSSLLDRYSAKKNWVLGIVVAFSLSLGAYTTIFPERLPRMISHGKFTPTATWLNLLAGMCFLIAGGRFFLDFYLSGDLESYLLVYLVLFFGLANLAFGRSAIWNIKWWMWHFLRLTAYLIALWVVVHGYITTLINLKLALAERVRAEKELEKYHLHLEELVKERTAQLTETNVKLRREIGERKQIEGILKIKDSAIASSINAVALGDLDGKITYVNNAFLKMWRYQSEGEVLEKSITKFWQKETKVLKILKRVYEKGGWVGELAARRKDGSLFYVQLSAHIVRDESKSPISMMSSFVDISSRKRMEKALRESEEKYSTLVTQARDGVAVIQDEVYKFVNMAMAQMTGYTIEELTGKYFLEVIASEYKNSIAQRYSLLMANKKIPSFSQIKIQNRDGTIKEVELYMSIIKYNRKPAMMAFIRDITERRKMEEEIQKIQKLESLGILAGGIAHDFNNLLTTIIGNLSLLELYAKSGKNILETLEVTKKASQQTKHLTQQLITFAKGELPFKKKASMANLLKEVTEFALSGSRGKCDLSIAEDLWWSEVDEGQINQAISNMIINADQAMPSGGVIKVSAENTMVRAESGLPLEEGKYVKISIMDQGIGIPKEYLKKVFDPYFSIQAKGSGLGLSIAYSIIKKHGGYITLESEVGIGTTFTIYLPAIKTAEKEIFAVKEIVEEKLFMGQGRILLMDDKEGVRETAGQILKYLGYEVEFARDGVEAIELYKKRKESGRQCFDAVILDLTVPGGMGGEEAIRELYRIDDKVKAIVSSGYSDDPVICKFKQYGFKGVVAKPYEIEEFSEVLTKVIMEKEE